MFRIIIISIAVTIGLAGCGENAPQKSVNEGSTAAQIKSIPVTSEMNTQDVKKPDVQAVAIQSQTMEASQAVAQALVKEQKIPEEKQMQPMKAVKERAVVEAVKEAPIAKPVKAKVAEPVAVKVNEAKNTVDSVIANPPKQKIALGDVLKGKKLAKRCVSCHDFGMKDKVGPHLQGVFDRAAGKTSFKKYSKALKDANWTWDEPHLLKWVCKSKGAVKEFTGDSSAKTKMPNQNMCGTKGHDIVSYLKTI